MLRRTRSEPDGCNFQQPTVPTMFSISDRFIDPADLARSSRSTGRAGVTETRKSGTSIQFFLGNLAPLLPI